MCLTFGWSGTGSGRLSGGDGLIVDVIEPGAKGESVIAGKTRLKYRYSMG
ncbi:MAG: hypothetical protein K8F91_10515 [Candidatus Obscuribacterales bacterium]|nr:hypothetical protein [Candidatus Obscuribacterales bacterium]